MVPTRVWNALTGPRRESSTLSLSVSSSILCAAAAVLASTSFFHSQRCFGDGPLPPPLRQMILAAGLEQDWQMFGTVPQQEQWVYGEAVLANGQVVDLLRQGRPLERERPSGGFPALGTHRWHKLFWVLPREDCRVFAAPTAAALARAWNARHDPGEWARTLEIRFAMRRESQGEVAVQTMLLAAWPPRGDAGHGNLERLLGSAAVTPDADALPQR